MAKISAFYETKLLFCSALQYEQPLTFDEWNLIPQIWDAVRRKCDETTEKGNYILTCSTKLKDDIQKDNIHHSGAGRIGKIQMSTMSLYESGDSDGKVSIMDMYNGIFETGLHEKTSLERIADLIIRGGWPSNINVPENKIGIIPNSYIKAILDKDIHDDRKRDLGKMRMLLRSLARNESTIVNMKTLLKDIEELGSEDEIIESRTTIIDYIDVLNRLHIIDLQKELEKLQKGILQILHLHVLA